MKIKYMWILKPIRLRNCASLRQFILRIMAQHFAVKIIVAISIGLATGLIAPQIGEPKIVIPNPIAAIIGIIFISPIVETLLLQTLMIELTRRFNRSVLTQFCAGMIPFALLHFFAGIIAGIAAGIVGGVFFSYTYLECREESWRKATIVTCITHFLHNLIALPLMFATASFG
jgi:hypothetical protein